MVNSNFVGGQILHKSNTFSEENVKIVKGKFVD